MSEAPYISVIIPTFNREKIIKRAIKSVLNQTFNDWELIIVDDCSEDNTGLIVSQYSDDRIIYHKLEQNLGNAGARNSGIKLAKADYISFLDSDDEFEPKALEIFHKKIEQNPGLDYAFGGYSIYNADTRQANKFLWEPEPEASFLEDLKIGIGCGILVKKHCFDKVGNFDENLRVAVDTDWLIRLDKKFQYELIKEYLVIIHTHEGERVRHDKSQLLKTYKIIYRKNKEVIEKNPKLILRFFYKLQWLSYSQQEISQGNSYFWYQFKKGIFSFKSFAAFIIYNILPLSLATKVHTKISQH